MLIYTVKKLVSNVLVSVILCAAVFYFSSGGMVYAGFMAAFLGACYLLAAWLKLLKSGGTDLLRIIKRKGPPREPYFHRRDKAPRSDMSHFFSDRRSEDSLPQEQSCELPMQVQLRGATCAYAICGAALLVFSIF